ncbi:glycoside hydrolase family 27 protein [Granulicella paludicola]|uniref:glycoside hydrolase family 27 protein n=1 Tax=Granulicella paludicola TaxID=474951 RepID=UPI0021E07EAE|nr:glycoside hydrolase family 27 protein [Granulicella paludicola]
MKTFLFSCVMAVMVCAGAGAQTPGGKAIAQTPPMGWNSWDAYGLTITEPQFRDNVRVLKTKLLPFGWNYAVIDEGWYFENPQDREKSDTLRYAIDAHGRYVPVPARFPSAGRVVSAPKTLPAGAKLAATIEETSFAALGRSVHAQGLKFGIHIIRGIPRVSTERNTPIEGSAFHAQDAADTSDACSWDPTSWGVKDNAAGQAWYDSLMRQYAMWGVDLIKVDCIGDHPYKIDEIRMIRRAIDKTGRPIVLSLSPGPMNLAHAEEVSTLANMWRISDDEWDVWAPTKGKNWPQTVKEQFPRLAAWAKYAKPGNWPDADMLAIGELRPHPGWGEPRNSGLDTVERRSLLSLWAMARSPLILGANLTLLDDEMLALLTNRDLIRIDQQGSGSYELSHAGDIVVWRSHLPQGEEAVAVFNLSEKEMTFKSSYAELDKTLGGKSWRAHNVWKPRDVVEKDEPGSGLDVKIPEHGCALYLLR